MNYPDAISDLISKSNTAISRMPINKDELNGDFRKHTAFSVFRLEFYKTKQSLNDEEVKLLLDPHMPTEMDLKTNKLVRRTASRVDNLSAANISFIVTVSLLFCLTFFVSSLKLLR